MGTGSHVEYNRAAHRKARKALRGLPCWVCGKPSDTVDHVPPKSAFPPGAWRGQYRPACARCNYSAGARLGRGLADARSEQW